MQQHQNIDHDDEWVWIFDKFYKKSFNITKCNHNVIKNDICVDCNEYCPEIAWDCGYSKCHQLRYNNYDRTREFKSFLKRYQGLYTINIIPDKLYSDLQDITDIIQLKKSMKRLGYSKYNKDIYYIFHRLTNIALPDLSAIENKLLLEFHQNITRKNIRYDWALNHLLEKFPEYKKDEYRL